MCLVESERGGAHGHMKTPGRNLRVRVASIWRQEDGYRETQDTAVVCVGPFT